jgi:sporulation protein YlmC with PRC-barrel domain
MTEISALDGKLVITKDAFNVGKISEAVMDDDWKITHIQVKLTKEAAQEIGLKKPYLGHVTVCLPTHYVRSIGDVITLSRNRSELKEMPECKIE